jgi:4-coumarate--CoA ligase
MPFKSRQPDIDRKYAQLPPRSPAIANHLFNFTVPRNITTWQWLFESPASPLRTNPSSLAGFTNAQTKERISWADMKAHTTHLSTALVKNYGLQPGETVALFSPNTIWYPVAMHSVCRVAGIISGASPAYNVEEMTYALKAGRAKFLMTVPGSMEVAIAAAKAAGLKEEHVFLLEGKLDGYKSVGDLIEIGKGYGESGQVPAYEIPKGQTNGDLCGFLSFSSGTTGLPKAVCIVHCMREEC